MTARELRILYSGKTWTWAKGGGYLAPHNKFYAAIGDDAETGSYARGTWLAGSNGRMCFSGSWTTAGKRSVGKTCFLHRISGDTIYQRKEPSGDWYTFRSSPPQSGDEAAKLVQGDQVSDRLKQLRAAK